MEKGDYQPAREVVPRPDPVEDALEAFILAYDLLGQPDFKIFYRLAAWAHQHRDLKSAADEVRLDYEAYRKWFAREKETFRRNKMKMAHPRLPKTARDK